MSVPEPMQTNTLRQKNEKQSFSKVYLCWEDMMILRRAGSVDGWVGGHFWLVNIFSLLRRHGLSNNTTNDSDDNSIACGHISHSDEGISRIEVSIDLLPRLWLLQ